MKTVGIELTQQFLEIFKSSSQKDLLNECVEQQKKIEHFLDSRVTAYVNGSATNGNEKFRRQRDEGKNFTAALI